MIEQSADIVELAIALHKAQATVDGVKKDSKNPHFKNNYASLEAVVETAKPALQANGIAFTQAPGALVDGAIEITTMLIHVSGQWMRSTLHVPLGKKDAQGVGSAITYGCRYSLMAMLGLPPVDDDGQEASKPAPRPAPARQQAEHASTHDRSDAMRYIAIAKTAMLSAESAAELDEWWRSEGQRRRDFGLVNGTSEFGALVDAFRARKAELDPTRAAA